MKRIRIVGLCLVAVVSGAVAVASASAAEPSIWQCGHAAKEGKVYLGHYTSKKCTPESKVSTGGKYELEEWNLGSKADKTGKEGKTKAFKGKGATADLEIVGVGGVYCSKSASAGEITGPKTAGQVKVTFTGCEYNGHKCIGVQPKATNTGEVLTYPLVGELGYISKPKLEVGVQFKPEAGKYFAEFNCEELKFRSSGAVIGKITSPLNTFTKELSLVFTESSGRQTPEMFEGGLTEGLLTEEGGKGEWSEGGSEKHQSGESTEVSGKGEELELKA